MGQGITSRLLTDITMKTVTCDIVMLMLAQGSIAMHHGTNHAFKDTLKRSQTSVPSSDNTSLTS